jgi:hypothetical protein
MRRRARFIKAVGRIEFTWESAMVLAVACVMFCRQRMHRESLLVDSRSSISFDLKAMLKGSAFSPDCSVRKMQVDYS